jgi:DNA-binding transcriptional MocR family regulator
LNDVLRLMGALGDWQARTGSGGLGTRLADAIADAIERGLLDGMRLPAERRLADGLRVSRSTVVRAYALLRERGLVDSRQRSGTVVRSTGGRLAGRHPLGPAITRLLDGDQDAIDLCIGAQRLDSVVADQAVRLGDAAALGGPYGYAPQGALALREALAAHLAARGVPAHPEELLITSGAQGALTLLAALLVGRGRPVLVEPTTYAGALEAFGRAGGTLVPVESDSAGIRPERLRHHLERGPAALLYLVPNVHNPTGGELAVGRRRALLAIADEHGVPVVEDTVLDDLRYAGPLRPTLQELSPERAIGVGSFSKLAWAGLRVGWIRAPRTLILRLARLKGAWDLGAPVLDQLMGLRLLEDWEALAAVRRAQAAEAMGMLTGALRRHLPDWEVIEPAGGLSAWAWLPYGRGEEVVAAALRHGVAVAPGSAHAAGAAGDGAVIVRTGAPREHLVEGVERLAAAWRELQSSGTRLARARVAGRP